MTESIFDNYWRQVAEELGKKPKERSLAIRLSGHSLDGFNGKKVVKRLHAALSCDGWGEKVGTNWKWNTSSHYTTKSEEVRLEREIVKADPEHWARQMATSSGIQGPGRNKRRAVDLVFRQDQDHYVFVELKIESDNPLFALFELLGYGLAYLHARKNRWEGAGVYDVMKAKTIDLVILAPSEWYKYKASRAAKEQSFDFEWLLAELNEGLASRTKGKPTMRLSFKEFAFPERSIDAAANAILCSAADWSRKGQSKKETKVATNAQTLRTVIVNVEASGLDPADGHRVIELAAVEMMDGRLTGRSIHTYLNPKRSIDPGALSVHGLSEEFLEDAPEFGEIADGFVKFMRGAVLVVHKASFHIGFLNAELARGGLDPLEKLCPHIVDTWQLAKALRPDMKNSIDMLCKDFKIKKPKGPLIGTELDANRIASIYVLLTAKPTA